MVKNQKQASITKEKLDELKKAKGEFEASEGNKKDPFKYELGINSFNSLIEDLETQLNEYNSLVEGNFHCLQAKTLEEIPKVLIAARLAQKMSQKDLAIALDLNEQQIQRYEMNDYEAASWTRIVEIAMALKMKFSFEKIMIINTNGEDDFNHPTDVTDKHIQEAERKIKNGHSLILG